MKRIGAQWNAYLTRKFPLCGGRLSVQMYNTLMVGSVFFFVFLAFNTTQNFETTVNADTGHVSLAILYSCFAFFNVISGFVVRSIGNRLSLVLGALAYAVYVASNIKVFVPVFYACSALLGVGASLIWTSQGAFLARQSTPDTFGFISGIFWAMFQANGAVGNTIAASLLNSGQTPSFVFAVLTVMALIGTALIALLIYPPISSVADDGVGLRINNASDDELVLLDKDVGDGDDDERQAATNGLDGPKTIWQQVSGTLKMFGDETMLHLVPFMIYSGLTQQYFFGALPLLFGKQLLGWGMVVLAICDTVGSFTMGRLSDWLGRKPVLFIGAATNVVGMLFACFGNNDDRLYMLFLAAALFGVSDSCNNTQIYAIVNLFCRSADRSAAGFAYFRFIGALSTALAFYYSIYLSFYSITIIIAGFLFIGQLFIFLLDHFVHSIEPTTPEVS
jgi:MFS transporter, NAG-T family, sugar:H+ symporter